MHSLFLAVFMLVLTYSIGRMVLNVVAPSLFNPRVYCKECGSTAKSLTFTPGSMAIELVLYMLFIIPGLIYSFWRMSKKQNICRTCKSTKVIPADSPLANKAA